MDDITQKTIEICAPIGNKLVADIKQRHMAAGQMVSGRTSALLHIEQTPNGFKLIGWQYSGTYEEGRQPNKTAWGRGGNHSAEWSEALIRWARLKGITFKSEAQAQGWAYCVMRKIATQGTQRYRDAKRGSREDIFETPIKDMQEALQKQWMFYIGNQLKRTLLRVDLKNGGTQI